MTTRKETKLIIVHCSATPPGMNIGRKEINEWHLNKGWSGIGYHYVIRRDGSVELGRDIEEIGAHAEGYNSVSVGVCLVGGVNDKKIPEANYTEAQWKTLVTLLKKLKKKYPSARIIGHNEVAKKACPSFNVQKWLSTVNFN